VSERIVSQHLGTEVLQALLEGDLPARECARAEEHLAGCARCAAELEGWRSLFRSLAELPVHAPSPAFSDRVLAGVARPEPLPLAARVRTFLGLATHEGHPSAERLQDFAERLLPARQAARLEAHLEGCAHCAVEARAWREAFAHLGRLERLAPSEGFSGRVMAHVRVPAPVPAPASEWRRALAWARSLVPQTRQAWATVSGVAFTPAVTLGLVLWTVLSHPTLTPGAMASYAGWKVSEFVSFAWQAVASRLLESAGLFEVYSFVGSLPWSPPAVVGAFLALSLSSVAAAYVLYRNLITPHPMDGRVAHASHS
jgi:anti-sigma factor RsiW